MIDTDFGSLMELCKEYNDENWITSELIKYIRAHKNVPEIFEFVQLLTGDDVWRFVTLCNELSDINKRFATVALNTHLDTDNAAWIING